jgi:hypothetical protein
MADRRTTALVIFAEIIGLPPSLSRAGGFPAKAEKAIADHPNGNFGKSNTEAIGGM